MNSIVQAFYHWYRDKIKHPKYRWLIIIGTVFYLLCPIDIAPDFIPILGWIDDGLLVSLLVTELSSLFLEYSRRGHPQNNSIDDNVSTEENFSQTTTIDVDPIS